MNSLKNKRSMKVLCTWKFYWRCSPCRTGLGGVWKMNSEHATSKATPGESAKATITVATANELNRQYQQHQQQQQQQRNSPQQHINDSQHLQLQQQQSQSHHLNEVSLKSWAWREKIILLTISSSHRLAIKKVFLFLYVHAYVYFC